jgi:co-chaperonin GroES (HSP10)
MKNKCILVKEIKQEETKTAGGIILAAETYNRKAKVIRSSSDDIAVGDTIIKTIGKGTMFNIDGEEYEILHEAHVLGIIG